MRRAQRKKERAVGASVRLAVLLVVLALVAGAYMGVAFAEENNADTQLDKAETSVQDADGSQERGADAEDGEANKVEPTSEVVTSYYHDAWYEAGQSDGTTPPKDEDGESDDAEPEGESGPENDAGSESEQDLEADQAGGEEEDLDPDLNDLGDSNTIDLQQLPDTSFLYDTTIYDLVNMGASGARSQTVSVKGEVVGEPLRAGNGRYWITLDHVDDDENDVTRKEASISVLVDEDVLQLIDTYGGYRKNGTVLRVYGTFYYACTSHEGIQDIHADSVEVTQRGSSTADVLDWNAFIPGLVMCGIALVLTIIYRVLSERQR